MIIKGQPNRVVQKKVRKRGGRHRIVPWFKFDSNGLAEVDENKLSNVDAAKLKRHFEVVNTVDEHVADEVINYAEMGYQELKKLCKERGIKAGRVSKDDLIELLEVSDE